MEINKPTLILTCLVIFFTGLVFGNFASNIEVTGYATKDQLTTISMFPIELKNGEPAEITIIPGAKGVYDELKYYNSNNLGVLGSVISRKDMCDSIKCYDSITVDFLASVSLKQGEYAAVVEDVATGTKIPVYFTVIE